MIVVDTSVWIDYFKGVNNPETEFLEQLLGHKMVAIGDLILLEILQGFKSDKDYLLAKQTLMLLKQYNFLNTQSAIKAADYFRMLRKKGITVRKTNDVIIASFCIEHQIPLLFTDRDFQPFVKHLGLVSALDN